jgi:hypothetical protein
MRRYPVSTRKIIDAWIERFNSCRYLILQRARRCVQRVVSIDADLVAILDNHQAVPCMSRHDLARDIVAKIVHFIGVQLNYLQVHVLQCALAFALARLSPLFFLESVGEFRDENDLNARVKYIYIIDQTSIQAFKIRFWIELPLISEAGALPPWVR